MKILAVDTSAIVASVALCENEHLLGEYTIQNGNTHSETLLPMIESLLCLHKLTPNEIDLFAASSGPGSFTGVRIGVSTVKGLAFDRKKPCIGVSTLEALAYNLCVVDGLVCPVMNARRNQVYTALFRVCGGKLERLLEDCAIPISELDEILAQYHEPIYLTGDGYDITTELLRSPTLPTPERLRPQSAYAVAQIARKNYSEGICTTDSELLATYLRPSQAERERADREGRATQL